MAYPATAHGGGFIPGGVSPVQQAAAPAHGGGWVPDAQQGSGYPTQQYGGNGQYQQQAGHPLYQNPGSTGASPYAAEPAQKRKAPLSSEREITPTTESVVRIYSPDDIAEYNDKPEYTEKRAFDRPIKLRAHGHRWEPYMKLRWLKDPHWARQSGYVYDSNQNFRFRDAMSRVHSETTNSDFYLSPSTGKIKTLVVQSVDDILSNEGNGTWKRTFIISIAPVPYRIAMWPYNHVDMREGSLESNSDVAKLVGKWIVASLALTVMIGFQGSQSALANSLFRPFPYKYYGYPKVARNGLEEDASEKKLMQSGMEIQPVAKRLLRPRYLCFLKDHRNPELCGWTQEFVDERTGGPNKDEVLSYIFVAYTAEQFRTSDDFIALHRIAERAARDAGVQGYWIGCTCMPEREKLHEDVWRISDVIRGCAQVVIAVGPPASNPYATSDDMLHQWGTRMWTFPEVLLAPSGKPILVYPRGEEHSPYSVAKNQFAAQVWGDSATSRQLIDHYEGSLILSRLELVTLALSCLNSRETSEYLPGDHAYALMGLLRRRPMVDATDTAFQAFARLSLANDSDRLLERLICTLPVSPDQPWFSTDDAYGVKLWDIDPSIQISGIGHDDTVIIDGARAANVRWKGFKPVASSRRLSWKRWIAGCLLQGSGFTFWLSIILVGLRQYAAGVILLIYSSALVFASPHLLRIQYSGKFWGTQPWFFAFEGYLPIETIEKQIFGAKLERLNWTSCGSPLSRHMKNEFNECIGIDPTTDTSVQQMVEDAKRTAPGEQKIFTLIDTSSMTVTLFQSARPPIGFMIVGAEGGMQRAIGVSLDVTTGILYRETVVRLETPLLSQMERMPRALLGLRRPSEGVRKRIES